MTIVLGHKLDNNEPFLCGEYSSTSDCAQYNIVWCQNHVFFLFGGCSIVKQAMVEASLRKDGSHAKFNVKRQLIRWLKTPKKYIFLLKKH